MRALLAAGASKVYAAARDCKSITEPGVVPVSLDVTRPEQISALAQALGDVNLLINNAGIGGAGSVLSPDSLTLLHNQFETNAVGPLRMA